MAGIGFELRKIFKKESLLSMLEGIGYSAIVTVGPMIMVISTLLIVYRVLDYTTVSFASRELLSSTILYVFIFALIFASPFNSVLSRYVADKLYEERFDDILPAVYIGLALNIGVTSLAGIPFVLRELIVGRVEPVFVFLSYCTYVSLTLVFYNMLYLSAVKEYTRIALAFFIGMLLAFGLSCALYFWLAVPVIYAILSGLMIGFFTIGFQEFAHIKKYFHANSGNYREVLHYFRLYPKLFFANLFYTLGLYCHNFVFWTTPMQILVVRCFYSAPAYDMASCLAMFTNISAMVVFIVQVETKFHERYMRYSQCVTGSTLREIQLAKREMFGTLQQQVTYIAEFQFIISVILFLIIKTFGPFLGFSGLTLVIYPSLAAAYYVIFIMYCLIIFLYYLNDTTGALLTSSVFLVCTFVFSLISTRLPAQLYGLGAFLGAFSGWTFGYMRLRFLEKNFDSHIFCKGEILPVKLFLMPDPRSYPPSEPEETEAFKSV